MKFRPLIEKFLKPAALITAVFVFWIHLGSIINFHQHHIFGRTLMPQGILCKREDSFTPGYDLPVCAESYFTADCATDLLVPEPHMMYIEPGCGPDDLLLPKSGIPIFHGLRAPPVVC